VGLPGPVAPTGLADRSVAAECGVRRPPCGSHASARAPAAALASLAWEEDRLTFFFNISKKYCNNLSNVDETNIFENVVTFLKNVETQKSCPTFKKMLQHFVKNVVEK
jgi:hypothetical protein